MEALKKLLTYAFGANYKISGIGLAVAMVGAGAAYAAGFQEPGWYLGALGLAALARYLASKKPSA